MKNIITALSVLVAIGSLLRRSTPAPVVSTPSVPVSDQKPTAPPQMTIQDDQVHIDRMATHFHAPTPYDPSALPPAMEQAAIKMLNKMQERTPMTNTSFVGMIPEDYEARMEHVIDQAILKEMIADWKKMKAA